MKRFSKLKNRLKADEVGSVQRAQANKAHLLKSVSTRSAAFTVATNAV
jgi:ribosomal protein L35